MSTRALPTRALPTRARITLTILILSLLRLSIGIAPAYAADWSWWPDPGIRTGRGMYLSYSNDYPSYQDPGFADQQAAALAAENVDVVFVQVSSRRPPSGGPSDLQRLSDRNDGFTIDVQYLLNDLAQTNITACAAIFSPSIKGDDGAAFAAALPDISLVDNVISFNRTRETTSAAFRCVIVDIEFEQPSQYPPVIAAYDAWKDFHQRLKTRMNNQAPDLPLLAYIQGPDSLIQKMDSGEQQLLMQREGIELQSTFPDFNLYRGAMKYFTVLSGSPIVDGIVPMWYVRSLDKYHTLLDHNADEVQAISGARPYLISGIKILMQNNQAVWCTTDCLQTRDDYTSVLTYNDGVRLSHSSFLGTSVFKWPFAPDWAAVRAAPNRSRTRILTDSQHVGTGPRFTLTSHRVCDQQRPRHDSDKKQTAQYRTSSCP